MVMNSSSAVHGCCLAPDEWIGNRLGVANPDHTCHLLCDGLRNQGAGVQLEEGPAASGSAAVS